MRVDPTLGEDREHAAILERTQRFAEGRLIATVPLRRDAPDRLAEPMVELVIVILARDHEAQEPARRGLEDQVVDSASMVRDQDGRAGRRQGRLALDLEAMQEP